MFDCAVIGGGPAGYRAAELIAKKGMKVVLIEKKHLGGVCLNEGCIPFKSYLHVSSINGKIRKLVNTGVFDSPDVSASMKTLHSTKDQIVIGLRQSVRMMLENRNVEIVFAEASDIRRTADGFEIEVGERLVNAGKVILALGSRTVMPNVENIQLDYRVIDSRSLLEMDDCPKNIDIIGAGVIGLEAASFFANMGSKVTLIECGRKIGGQIDGEIAEALKRVLTRKGIDILTETKFCGFEPDGVCYESEGQPVKRQTETVMFAMGRKPAIEARMLDDLGVKYTDKGIDIDEQCETSMSGIYACGDITGKNMLAHNAFYQASVITESIAGNPITANYTGIPRVIYSDPEVLTVGMTEEECREKAIKYKSVCLPMTYSGRYYAENGKDGAKAKLLIDTESRVIGFHMIGNGSSEISLAAEMMVRDKKTLSEMKDLIFAHPTYVEIISDLVNSFEE